MYSSIKEIRIVFIDGDEITKKDVTFYQGDRHLSIKRTLQELEDGNIMERVSYPLSAIKSFKIIYNDEDFKK